MLVTRIATIIHVGLAVAVVVGVAATTINYHCVLLRGEDATF